MPELHACYFCGTPNDLSRVAVIPPRFDPDEDEQRTVNLCPTCREKLVNVVEPLATRLDAAREAAGAPPDDPDARARHLDDDAPSSPSEGAPSPPSDDPAPDSPADHGDGDGDDFGGFESAGGGITFPADDGDDAGGAAADSDPDDPLASGSPPSDDPSPDSPSTNEEASGFGSLGSDDAGDDAGNDSASSSRPSGGAPPDGFRRVMRLLENRDLPVSRAEMETIAANAYDIGPEKFDRIVETAAERGRLVDEDGQLRKP